MKRFHKCIRYKTEEHEVRQIRWVDAIKGPTSQQLNLPVKLKLT